MRDQTVGDLNDLHRKAKSARSRLEPVWYLNLSYYCGEQWIAWDGRALYRPKLKANRITIVDNRIQPAVRTEIAKMTKNRPVFTISPRTSDEEDSNAAQLGEELMRYLWKHLNMQELSTKALYWSRITGAGFLKCFWDPNIGDGTDCVVGPGGKVLEDGSGKALKPSDISPEDLTRQLGLPEGSVKSKKVKQGDIRVEARSPFQMFVDPLCDTFDEAEWVIEESIKSVGYVKERYGVTLTGDASANPGLIESRMGGSVQPGTGSYKGVRLREYWHKPSDEHPNGFRAVWAKEHMLLQDNKPFDPFPYVMLSAIPIPGRLWPTSIAEQLRGPQTELNKVKSQIAENRNRVGNPTILASKQAVQDPEKFADSTTMPGGIYFFDDLGSPNTIPTYLQAPALPAYVVEEIQRIEESMQEISGQHEVTNANVPAGVTAASAINLLQESDNTRLGPGITDYETQLGKFGQKVLKLAAHYYTDARTIRISGDNGVWQIFDFRGSMLRDNTHVEVQAGSAFPQSMAAKQAAGKDMLDFFVQSGNPPHGRQLALYLKDMQFGGTERLVEEYTTDEQQAERENVKMQQNHPVTLNDFDNDQAHVDAHQAFQKQQKYEQLEEHMKQLFEMHVQQHKARLAQQQQAQMQLEAQQQGQPGPGQVQAQGQMDMQGQAQQQAQQAAQAQSQQGIKEAQAQHDIAAKGAQQGHSMNLAAEQQAMGQRHAEDQHHQKLSHQQMMHEQQIAQQRQQAQAEEARAQALHAAKLKQMQMQAQAQQQQAQQAQQSQSPQGGQRGR